MPFRNRVSGKRYKCYNMVKHLQSYTWSSGSRCSSRIDSSTVVVVVASSGSSS